MRAPRYWDRDGLVPALLAPLGYLYAAAGATRYRIGQPVAAPIPVICVGNLVAGGAGKTPVAIALARRFQALGRPIHFLTRGYGGAKPGPLAVDPAVHGVRDVGDEALLLADVAPTWVAADRAAGAAEAVAGGARVLIMDDGFQNPGLKKDLSLLVVDGAYGFGNGRVMPAGPLREPVWRGLARAAGVVLLGPDEAHVTARLAGGPPILRARVEVADESATALRGRRVYAFAGIGRPEKFFRSLEELGAKIVGRREFPDHHVFRAGQAARLIERARALDAVPVTTAKDAVRLPPAAREALTVLRVRVVWEEPAAVDDLIAPVLGNG